MATSGKRSSSDADPKAPVTITPEPATLSSSNSNNALSLSMSDSRISMISSLLNICERATIRMDQEGIANTVKALVIISMKFVDKEALFKSVLPDTFIDWEFIR